MRSPSQGFDIIPKVASTQQRCMWRRRVAGWEVTHSPVCQRLKRVLLKLWQRNYSHYKDITQRHYCLLSIRTDVMHFISLSCGVALKKLLGDSKTMFGASQISELIHCSFFPLIFPDQQCMQLAIYKFFRRTNKLCIIRRTIIVNLVLLQTPFEMQLATYSSIIG